MDILNQTEIRNNLKNSLLKESTILYLEEDDKILEETQATLEKIFKKVLIAKDGKKGLELFNTYKDSLDIILTEIKMPVMDGVEFMTEVRKVSNTIPILIVTAFTDGNILAKAVKFNISDYILKPIQINSTLKIVLKILEDRLNKKLVDKQKHELEIYKDILDEENLISETDENGKIIHVNKIFTEITGYSEKDIIGQTHKIIVHPDFSQTFFKDLWETVKRNQIWKGKIKNFAKDGSVFYVQATVFPILDNDDKLLKYVFSSLVITEQIQEKHKLKKYILHQKSQQIKQEKRLQDEYEDAVKIASMEKDEQIAKFISELNSQIKVLRTKNSDDKGRILSLERKLKDALDKNDDLQKNFLEKIEKLNKTAVVAAEQYNSYKKKHDIISEKFTKSQEGIVVLQGYVDEYRQKIKDLEDLIQAYEKQFGKLSVR